jgi:NAD(P)-dependent dehydrogenase (short-subunit alcohol dehydrogenase family)
MTIADKTVLVTGANRGIGQALVAEALRRGAKHVYAGTRQPLTHPDGRVTPLTLDVTNPAPIQAAAGRVEALDLLINNAGVFGYDDLSDRAALERHLAVNLFGTYGVTRAFLPLLARSRGAIVNNVSLMALAARAAHAGLLGLQGGRVLPDPAAAGPAGGAGRAGPCRADRPGRHRHGPRPRHPQDLPGIGRQRGPGRRGGRGGGHLPPPHVPDPGRGLARRGGQGARTPERSACRSAHSGLSKGTLTPCNSQTCRLRQSPGHRWRLERIRTRRQHE